MIPDYEPGHELLAGKRVLITAAAGSGIGSATAKRCVEEGAVVMVSDRHGPRLAETAAELGAASVLCDVTDEESVQAMFAAAIQEMWRKHLNIEVELINQEWKVYLDSQRNGDYFLSRAGWIGDYVDPNSFMDMWTSWSQQNQTGWSTDAYDELIAQAGKTGDAEQRLEYFQQAEEILMAEAPIIPIYIYTRVYLLDPAVKNWNPTILDHHPYKHLYLESN